MELTYYKGLEEEYFAIEFKEKIDRERFISYFSQFQGGNLPKVNLKTDKNKVFIPWEDLDIENGLGFKNKNLSHLNYALQLFTGLDESAEEKIKILSQGKRIFSIVERPVAFEHPKERPKGP